MEKKDPPVFSKKEKIIIASIFAILFLASIIVTAYLVSEGYPGGFEGVNAVPIVVIIMSLMNVTEAYLLRHKDIHVYNRYSFFRHPFRLKIKDYTYDAEFLKTHYVEIFLVLSQISIQIPLVVYVHSFGQAVLSFVIYCIPYIVLIVIEIFKYKGQPINRTYFIPVFILLILEENKKNLPSARKKRELQSEINEHEERENLQKRFWDKY